MSNTYIGRFKIIKEIGHGGVGRVYRAHDPNLGRDVALKMLISGEFAEEAEIKRFQREVESCARLRHPNIVPLYEIGQEAGRGLYMVMELIDGVPLDDYIHQRRVYPHHAAQIICTIAKAVHYAHEQGVIHRDIKPQNILMKASSFPMLTDFGLARQFHKEDKERLTKTGELLGTPAYMPPEQINGMVATRQMDVYSLGSVLYELLTGCPPYEGDELQVICNVLDESEGSPAPRKRRPDISKDINTICQKAMAKDYTKRYRNALELGEELERYLRGLPIKARPISIIERMGRWSRKHPIKAVTVFLSCLALFLGIVLAQFFERRNRFAKIEEFIHQGNVIYERMQSSEIDILKSVREARIAYEKALVEDRHNQEAKEKLYRLELYYGGWALQNGYLERARDAFDNAKALGYMTAELKQLETTLKIETEFQHYINIIQQSSQPIAERKKALEYLTRQNNEKSFRDWVVTLNDPSAEISGFARKILLEIPLSKRTQLVLQVVPYIQEKEAEILANFIDGMDEETVKGLVSHLKSKHFWVIKNVLVMLSLLKAETAVPYLSELLNHPKPSIQLELCKTYKAIGSVDSIPAILSLLDSSKQIIAIEAADTLGEFKEKAKNKDVEQSLLRKIEEDNPVLIRYHAWKALMSIYPETAIPMGCEMIQIPDTPLQLCQNIWEHLAKAHFLNFVHFLELLPEKSRLSKEYLKLYRLAPIPELMERLRECLQNSVPAEIQRKAIKILAELNEENSLASIGEGLKSRWVAVRREAAFTLCLLSKKGKKLPPIIQSVLNQEKDFYVQIYLAWAITKAQDSSFEKTALSLVKKMAVFPKISGIIATSRCYSATCLETLKKYVQDNRPLVVQYTAWSLGEWKEKAKELSSLLNTASKKHDKATRYYIEMALKKIESQ